MQALVFKVQYEAPDIVSIELRPDNPENAFPIVEAGAHIDLHLGNGLVRSYSLTNPGDTDRYVVAVLKDRRSRGGSTYVHEKLRIGQVVSIGVSRNYFKLDETVTMSVLLAGGIGITPIYAMLKRLSVLKRNATLIYCARSRVEAAFVAQIQTLVDASGTDLAVIFHFDDEHGGPPNLEQLLGGYAKDTHFYCCGPAPMLDAYEQACERLGQHHVHLERFEATGIPSEEVAEGYAVELKKSGRTVWVEPGIALLDALIEVGIRPDFNCREGVCGACETRVISGDVIHRDHILTKQEWSANKSMMICVSSCRTGRLVLDI